MEPQLATLIKLDGVEALVHEWFLHDYQQGPSVPVWTLVTGIEHETERVFVRDHTGYELPHSVDPAELRVGLGTRLPNESLILKFRNNGLRPVDQFLIPEPQAPAPPPWAPTPVPQGPCNGWTS
jgi:hypothetical protein